MPPLKHLPRAPRLFRRATRVVLTLLALATGLFAEPNLTLRVSSETAPPGSTAQIKIFAATPALVTVANFSMDFDPQVFDGIASVAAFSASGDQIGYANVNGQHLDAHFRSSSGGFGQLRSLPIFVISVRVLASAPAGTTRAISLTPIIDADGIGWDDTRGDALAVTVTPGTFTVGGSLSVTSIFPGGGLLPAATVLAIQGAGFQPQSTVALDGVPIASTKYVSPNEIELTLGGQTELTGKHLTISNPGGETVNYFAALPSAPVPLPPNYKAVPNVQPILPLTTYTAIEVASDLYPAYSHGVALLNPNATPATIALVVGSDMGFESTLTFRDTLTLPPGGLYFFDTATLLDGDAFMALWVTSSAPLRAGFYTAPLPVFGPMRAPSVTPPNLPADPPPTQVTLQLSPPSVSWSLQQGSTTPAPAQVRVLGSGSFTVSVPPAASWLTVTPASGTVSETAFATLTLTPNLSGLNPGTYTTTVTITPVVQAPYTEVPSTIAVTLTVTAAAQLSVLPSGCCYFLTPATGAPAQTIILSSNGDPMPFTATVVPGTGGSWLSVTPLSGTTPATLTLTVMLSTQLPGGQYSSQIVIQSPNATLTVPVTLQVIPPPPPPPPASGIQVSPASLSFVLAAGSPAAMLPQVITIHPNGVSFTATTQSGNWMSAQLFANDYQTIIQVNASAVGLSPGNYQGNITITLDPFTPVQIPVSLIVLPVPTAQTRITATPSSLTLNAPAGQVQTQTISLDSGGTPVLFSLSEDNSQNSEGSLWQFGATVTSTLIGPNDEVGTPAIVTIGASASLPGSYYQALTIEWATGSITIPVTFNAQAVAAFPPILSGVLNAASLVPGPIASGEMVTILGTGIGPTPQVLINGVSATVLYASATQVNAILPANLDVTGTASLQVICNGVASQTWDLPLAPAAPGIFTADSTGAGPGIVFNQDGSLNSPSNPASRGSTIQIYATGGGLNLPVTATLGGIEATAQIAGQPPGLLEINAPVPQALSPGTAVPITITIGTAGSAEGVTISVI